MGRDDFGEAARQGTLGPEPFDGPCLNPAYWDPGVIGFLTLGVRVTPRSWQNLRAVREAAPFENCGYTVSSDDHADCRLIGA